MVRYRVGCSSDRIIKLVSTAAAAAAANFIWHSTSLADRSISLDHYNIIALMAFGFILAVPLDRLVQ